MSESKLFSPTLASEFVRPTKEIQLVLRITDSSLEFDRTNFNTFCL